MKKELRKIGRNAFACIKEMVEAIETDEGRQAIEDDALSFEIRSDWYEPGATPLNNDRDGEFRILLSTGGPAVRMIGELTDGEPSSARLEVQDWGTPWTEYPEADVGFLLGDVMNPDERRAFLRALRERRERAALDNDWDAYEVFDGMIRKVVDDGQG